MRQALILLIFSLGLISAAETCKFTEYLNMADTSLYQHWIDPQEDVYNGKFCFEIRADHDAFIMLASDAIKDVFDGPNIEINLGCCGQSQIILRSNGSKVVTSDIITPDVLDEKKFIDYCIIWEVGNYSLYRSNQLVLEYKRKTSLFPVKVIGLRKWFEGDATFKYERNC